MRISIASLIAVAMLSSGVWAGEIETALATIQQVGSQAAGATEATGAWKTLSESDGSEIPALLAAIDDGNPLAANYIRSAIEAIAEREGKEIPTDALEDFIRNVDNNPRARRLAYELWYRVDQNEAWRLLPDLLHDPSVELRRDAVRWRLNNPRKLRDQQVVVLRSAFEAAVDDDQVKEITKRLKDLGEEVDIARHYGFIMNWHVVGPFDNAEEKGFDKPRGPEGEDIDLAATYEGSHGVGAVKWQAVVSNDEYGRVDLNEALGKHKSAIAYAVNTFKAAQSRPIELRYKSKNACKVWLNGALVGKTEVYHSDGGPSMDQYIGKGELKRGGNTILVKVCQNDQDESWAQDWAFHLRVCDAVGAAVLAQNRSVIAEDEPESPKIESKLQRKN